MSGMERPCYPGNPRTKEMPAGMGGMRVDCTTANIPADGTAGYEAGCILQVYDGVSGNVLLVNTGTALACAFRLLANAGMSLIGFIPLPLDRFRAIASNAIPVSAGTPPAGILASNSSPIFNRVNGATDKGLRIVSSATTAIEFTQGFYYPLDMDVTKAYSVNLRMASSGGQDTPTIAIGVFEGVGDTNRGGNTAAVAANTSLQTLSISVIPTGAHPNFASVSITPGTHGNDDFSFYEIYVLYARKLLV